MDATTLGTLLAGVGALAGAVVAFVGKRGENAINGYSSLTQDLQEERDALRGQLAERDVEITRLRALVKDLGGTP